MTSASGVVGLIVACLACAAARQAARRKGRTLAWGVAAFFFPPSLLILELLSTNNPAPAGIVSNLVLEWVASLAVLGVAILIAIQL